MVLTRLPVEGYLPLYSLPTSLHSEGSGGKDLVQLGLTGPLQSWINKHSPTESRSFRWFKNQCVFPSQLQIHNRVRSAVVMKETTSSAPIKMFRWGILAVGLGQTRIGGRVKGSARVAAFECGSSSHSSWMFTAAPEMSHAALIRATAPLRFSFIRGPFRPGNSVLPLKADAIMRGERE